MIFFFSEPAAGYFSPPPDKIGPTIFFFQILIRVRRNHNGPFFHQKQPFSRNLVTNTPPDSNLRLTIGKPKSPFLSISQNSVNMGNASKYSQISTITGHLPTPGKIRTFLCCPPILPTPKNHPSFTSLFAKEFPHPRHMR